MTACERYLHGDFTPSPANDNRCPECFALERRGMAKFTDWNAARARLSQLKENPGLVDQDVFGICGTSAIVLGLAAFRPTILDALFAATFHEARPGAAAENPGFRLLGPAALRAAGTPDRVRISLRYLARKYQRMVENYVFKQSAKAEILAARQASEQSQHVTPGYEVDYALSRALGYLLWKTSPDRYRSEKLDFNAAFAPAGSLRDWSRVGNLALRTNSMAYILLAILGQRCSIVRGPGPVDRIAPDVPGVASVSAETTAAMVAQLTGLDGRLAIAAVFAEVLNDREPPPDGSDGPGQITKALVRKPAQQGFRYNHWIVISAASEDGEFLEVEGWSWAGDEQVRIRKSVLTQYIVDLVIVEDWRMAPDDE